MRKLAGICLVLCLAGDAGAWETPPPAGFADTIEPLLREHCIACHGPKMQEAKLALHKLTGNMAADGTPVWETIREQIQSGAMPPEDRERPASNALKLALAWIDAEVEKANTNAEALARLYPVDGNRLEHGRLFGIEPEPAAASPPRLWRVNPEIYGKSFSRITKVQSPIPTGGPIGKVLRQKIDLSSPWGLMGDVGIKDYSSIYRIDEPETELLLDNAASMARYLMTEPKPRVPEFARYRAFIAKVEQVSPEESAELTAGVFQHCLLREPTDEELARYEKLLREGCHDLGRKQGLETLLTAVLARADSVFRVELGGGQPDEYGRVMLAPRELAFAISFSLTDAAPDTELLRAAIEGKLQTRDEVRRQVERLLALPSAQKPPILRFFREYFGYPEAEKVFKDAETLKKAGLGMRFNPEVFVKDTDRLILHILEQDTEVLKELLTTNKTFLSSAFWNTPWLNYNLPQESLKQPLPLELPSEQRAGILTQPSWLIAHSTNFDNHAIHRGKWVRENLLGGSIPATPITVEAQLPDDPHQTLRERMAVTREAFCWKCHQRMDPLGLSFEMYDHFGQYRTTEHDKPVETSGGVIASGDASLDGPVANALELVRKLADSPHVEQVFVRHVFRFWMGRNEQVSDAGALQDAHRAYRESGGSMQALLASLLTSDVVLYRTVSSTK